MKHNDVTFRILALQKILSIQNSSLDIRISALDSDFSSLAEQTMLMLGGGDSVRAILQQNNYPLTCKKDDSDYYILEVLK